VPASNRLGCLRRPPDSKSPYIILYDPIREKKHRGGGCLPTNICRRRGHESLTFRKRMSLLTSSPTLAWRKTLPQFFPICWLVASSSESTTSDGIFRYIPLYSANHPTGPGGGGCRSNCPAVRLFRHRPRRPISVGSASHKCLLIKHIREEFTLFYTSLQSFLLRRRPTNHRIFRLGGGRTCLPARLGAWQIGVSSA